MRFEVAPGQEASFKYCPDIDGLRAKALTTVFIFHPVPHWLPGGSVGVGVFFVISSCLINLVAKELASLSLARPDA